jgi:hypothetical protein
MTRQLLEFCDRKSYSVVKVIYKPDIETCYLTTNNIRKVVILTKLILLITSDVFYEVESIK